MNLKSEWFHVSDASSFRSVYVIRGNECVASIISFTRTDTWEFDVMYEDDGEVRFHTFLVQTSPHLFIAHLSDVIETQEEECVAASRISLKPRPGYKVVEADGQVDDGDDGGDSGGSGKSQDKTKALGADSKTVKKAATKHGGGVHLMMMMMMMMMRRRRRMSSLLPDEHPRPKLLPLRQSHLRHLRPRVDGRMRRAIKTMRLSPRLEQAPSLGHGRRPPQLNPPLPNRGEAQMMMPRPNQWMRVRKRTMRR